jgi:hypothetical protein
MANIPVDHSEHEEIYRYFPSKSSSSSSSFSGEINDSLLQIADIGAEMVWESLVQEASALMRDSSSTQHQALPLKARKSLTAFEVGMHRAKQCLQAAREGLQVHCIEPSPANFRKAKRGIRQEPKEIQDRVHVYRKAAGATSGLMLSFTASGRTGDHVGIHDFWNMQVGRPKDAVMQKKVGSSPIHSPG